MSLNDPSQFVEPSTTKMPGRWAESAATQAYSQPLPILQNYAR